VSKRVLFPFLATGLIVLLLACSLAAQQPPAPSPAPSQDPQQAQPGQPPPNSAQQPPADQPPPAAKKPKKDKKPKPAPGQQDTLDTSVFSERTANDVLGQIRDGLEGHSTRLLLGAFSDDMDGYLNFEDQIEAFFKRYEGFHVNLRIVNTAIEGNKGIVTAEFQMEEMTRGSGKLVRKESQLRFELERGKKGWRVVNMSPRGFFS
jgi:hypothetical protein